MHFYAIFSTTFATCVIDVVLLLVYGYVVEPCLVVNVSLYRVTMSITFKHNTTLRGVLIWSGLQTEQKEDK